MHPNFLADSSAFPRSAAVGPDGNRPDPGAAGMTYRQWLAAEVFSKLVTAYQLPSVYGTLGVKPTFGELAHQALLATDTLVLALSADRRAA